MDTCVSSVAAAAAVETPVAKPSLWSRFKGWLADNGLDMALGGLIGMVVGLALTFVPVPFVAIVGAIIYIGSWLVGMIGLVGALIKTLA